MLVDYLLANGQWAGPRRGWNLAGWISWAVGFIVGIAPLVGIANIPAAPLVAFIVGAALYFILAKAGLQPQAEMPAGMAAPVVPPKGVPAAGNLAN
jgi:cytosine permease